jgi:asparagine synthase (glutamine-hydrolysing)
VKRESPVIDVSFVEGTGVADLLSGETKPFDPPNTVRQAHYNQLRRPLLQVTLEISDKVAAMHGVEPRYPFFDKRLVEFCLSLPPTQKFGGNQTRVVMRRGLEGIYPDPIANRTDKTSLAPNFERGLFERDRDLLERLCENVPVELEAAVDEETLNETLERVRNGEPESGDAIALWRIGTLSHWGQQRERNKPVSVNREPSQSVSDPKI